MVLNLVISFSILKYKGHRCKFKISVLIVFTWISEFHPHTLRVKTGFILLFVVLPFFFFSLFLWRISLALELKYNIITKKKKENPYFIRLRTKDCCCQGRLVSKSVPSQIAWNLSFTDGVRIQGLIYFTCR